MSSVLSNGIPTQDGKKIIEIRLNSACSLTELPLDIIAPVQAALAKCKIDDSIVAIILSAGAEQVLCAVANVANLYRAMPDKGETSFSDDLSSGGYQLHHTIQTYPKPVIYCSSTNVIGLNTGVASSSFLNHIADSFAENELRNSLIQRLQAESWNGPADIIVDRVLQGLAEGVIQRTSERDSLEDILEEIVEALIEIESADK